MRPTLRVSLAAKAVALEPTTAAVVAAADTKKDRRVSTGESPERSWQVSVPAGT